MTGPRRIVLPLVVAVVVVVAVFALRDGGSPYEVTVQLQDADQLVTGNEVRLAGAVVGTVKSIDLADDGVAAVKVALTKDEIAPLHEGTRALVRNSSVSSIAGRYIALELAPDSAPVIRSGGAIPLEDTRTGSDFDALLNAIDIRSRQSLQAFFRDGSQALSGDGGLGTGRTIEELNPALKQVRKTLSQIGSDTAAFQRLLVGTATAAEAFASRRQDIEQGLVSTAATVRAIEAQRNRLTSAVRKAPRLLAQTRTTLRDADGLLRDARPVVRNVTPLAPKLATTLRLTKPTTDELRPLLRTLRRTLPDFDAGLTKLPSLQVGVSPLFRDTARALQSAQPVLAGLRPYTPDLVHGLLGSFGGRAGGIYDATGHLGRVAPVFNSSSFTTTLRPLLTALDPALGSLGLGQGIQDPSTGNVNRCPGGGDVPAKDGSRPLTVQPACDPASVIGGKR